MVGGFLSFSISSSISVIVASSCSIDEHAEKKKKERNVKSFESSNNYSG